MSKYQRLVRALFQSGIIVVEMPLEMAIKSFSSKDDKLIVINTSRLIGESDKYEEVIIQARIFKDDSFINLDKNMEV